MFKTVVRKDKKRCPAFGCRNQKASKQAFCAKHVHRKKKAEKPLRYAFDLMKNNARTRGVVFELSFVEFVQFCRVTGYMENKGRRATALHIDRIEISLGYRADNIQVLSNSDNVKKQHTVDYNDCPF